MLSIRGAQYPSAWPLPKQFMRTHSRRWFCLWGKASPDLKSTHYILLCFCAFLTDWGQWHTCLLTRSKYTKQAQDWRFPHGAMLRRALHRCSNHSLTMNGPGTNIKNHKRRQFIKKWERRDFLKRYSKDAKTSKNLEKMGMIEKEKRGGEKQM